MLGMVAKTIHFMFTNTPVRISTEITGQKITLEAGLLAQQATASVLATIGETSVLAAVVIGKPTSFEFFPLQVIYEERLYASGKIKGSRFVKREGRPTDNAVLTGRLVDRSMRSLLPDSIRNDIQIVITVLSLDEVNSPDLAAVLAASAALTLCGMTEFAGPTSAVRIGLDPIANEYLLNPSYEQLTTSDLDMIVCGNGENIVMVEAGAQIIPEEVIAAALDATTEYLAGLTQFQLDFAALSMDAGLVKHTVLSHIGTHPAIDMFWSQLSTEIEHRLFGNTSKHEANEKIHTFKQSIRTQLKTLTTTTSLETSTEHVRTILAAIGADDTAIGQIAAHFDIGYDRIAKKIVEQNILEKGRRLDGRALDETRLITAQIDVLPRVHGASLFSRGETQVLNIITLGTNRDAQTLDDMENFEEEQKRYIHHYNFPSYSVGETGRYTGPGRREIGHGALAERALMPVLPDENTFPYTLRLVSECLGSNGSTSMASTCASSLSLMAAGVPISAPVAGVAMGLILGAHTQSELQLGRVRLASDTVELTPLTMNHAAALLEHYTPAVTQFLSRGPFGTLAITQEYIAFTLEQARAGRTLTLAITDTQSHAFLGVIDVYRIQEGTPTIGIWIGEPYQHRGHGQAALQLTLAWIQQYLSYRHIRYDYDERNAPSITLAHRNGFEVHHYYPELKTDTGEVLPLVQTRNYTGGTTPHSALLTDIQGAEDHFGDMDFKVTGTRAGITAIQLDNKAAGLTVETLKTALIGSKMARLHILDIMDECISAPRSNISQYAPGVATIDIPFERIGDVIGPSGKIIKSIIARTGVDIDIADDTGKTFVYGKDAEKVAQAIEIIRGLTKEYLPGTLVDGEVFRVETYGAFVKIDGTDKEGMIHISSMSKDRSKSAADFYTFGQKIKVMVSEINDKGQIRLTPATPAK
jgi:polyribonucleotide nucleotidyltransferase